MKVLIATPAFNGMITTNYMMSLIKTLIWCHSNGIEAQIMTPDNESLIPRARNRCATFALKNGFDKLFFIDGDLTWEPLQFGRILVSDSKLVGGTYPMKRYPLTLNFNLPDKKFRYDYRSLEGFMELRKDKSVVDGEVEAKHIPTGFMCIDHEVLEKLAKHTPPYSVFNAVTHEEESYFDFFPTGVRNKMYESEDWGFCSLAKEHGFKPMLDTQVIVAHTGVNHYGLDLISK